MKRKVISTEDEPWTSVTMSAFAKGFQYKPMVGPDDYETPYSCEIVKVPPTKEPKRHRDASNHMLFILSGKGETTIGDEKWRIGPGSMCFMKAGEIHAVVNYGPEDMVALVVYDPPWDWNKAAALQAAVPVGGDA